MPLGGDPSGDVWLGLDPAALEEPRRRHVPVGEDVEDRAGHARTMPAIRVLRIEGERDALRAICAVVGRAYFSTPLTTMPRVKNRWKSRKITTGMIIVISVPAWMNAWFR